MDLSWVYDYLPDLSSITENLPDFVNGAWITIQLTVVSLIIGFFCAIPIALARLSRNPLLRWPAYGFMFYFRGTPLIVQIFLIYYGSGQFVSELKALGLWTFFREPYFCAILTLVLNTAAYTAEILRGAIQAVPHGEVEAARACGMSPSLAFRRIVFPKAMRLALPAYTNEVVFLFQATSLVSIITILDLTGVARVLIAKTFDVFEIWIFVALCYLVLTYVMLYGFKALEYRLMGHLRDRETGEAPAPAAKEAIALR